MQSSELPSIFLVSDSSGETAEKVMHSVLAQFDVEAFVYRKIGGVEDVEYARAICQELPAGSLVCTTLVQPEVRAVFDQEAQAGNWHHVDLIGRAMDVVSAALQQSPSQQPGQRHRTVTAAAQAAAIDFAVRHDDGMGLRSIEEAQVVLAGPSRLGKTAISMYLATKGYRIANVPFVSGVGLPDEIAKLPAERVVGLVIDADKLLELREFRMQQLGSKIRTQYTDAASIEREMQEIRETCRSHGWRVLDVSDCSVEQAGARIEKLTNLV